MLTMLVHRIPRGANYVCTTRDLLLQALLIKKLNSAAPCCREKGLQRQVSDERVILPRGQFTSKRSERLVRPCAGAFRSFGRQKNIEERLGKEYATTVLRLKTA